MADTLTRALFEFHRITRPDEIPAADPAAVDVAILDMNHGWPNVGHDSIVRGVANAAKALAPELRERGLTVRALSYEVRRHQMIPAAPGDRFHLYLGTGGPGHLDPRRNDGVSEGSQGIRENPAWERPLFALFDAIERDEDAALLAVCHTFGVLCRWSGIAEPVLRDRKSSGIRVNELTGAALEHPWFRRFASELRDGRRFSVMDSRLYDLVPTGAAGAAHLAFEGGRALTMIELARDRDGVMPRLFAVNHHPEIVDRDYVLSVLDEKRDRGDVTTEWYEERARALVEDYSPEADAEIHRTAEYTFLRPLRFQLERILSFNV